MLARSHQVGGCAGPRAKPGVVIALDLSRLLSRAGREVPTGIDRVELAYAERLIADGGPRLYPAMTGWGAFGLLPSAPAEAYVAALARSWRGGNADAALHLRRARRLALRLRIAPLLWGERRLHARLRQEAAVYLLVSHHHLQKRAVIARLKQRSGAPFVFLIHDLIPIEFPEYALPGQDRNHRRRIETAAAFADAVIVNSAVTRDAFLPYLERIGRSPPVLVAPFGAALPAPTDGPPPLPGPYFVYLSTIEARKNHLMLLNLWRRLATELGEEVPRLVLIGQRGWETENVIDMLERSPRLRGLVIEHNALPDAEVARLLKGARALLLPSFAEGFGFPLVEALTLGVPALCSTIPALRESGADVPEYLDPIDGEGWRQAVLDYAAAASPRREAQLRRLAGWRPPGWDEHFAAVGALIAETAARPPTCRRH